LGAFVLGVVVAIANERAAFAVAGAAAAVGIVVLRRTVQGRVISPAVA